MGEALKVNKGLKKLNLHSVPLQQNLEWQSKEQQPHGNSEQNCRHQRDLRSTSRQHNSCGTLAWQDVTKQNTNGRKRFEKTN